MGRSSNASDAYLDSTFDHKPGSAGPVRTFTDNSRPIDEPEFAEYKKAIAAIVPTRTSTDNASSQIGTA